MPTVTIKLPEKLYEQLRRTAELTQQPLDAIVADSLTHSLAPLLEDIPTDYHADVYPLLQMSDQALQEEVKRTFPPDDWAEYEALLQCKKNRSLTNAEQSLLDDLCYQADVLTFRKGYAAVLLQRRGRRIPPPSELPTVR